MSDIPQDRQTNASIAIEVRIKSDPSTIRSPQNDLRRLHRVLTDDPDVEMKKAACIRRIQWADDKSSYLGNILFVSMDINKWHGVARERTELLLNSQHATVRQTPRPGAADSGTRERAGFARGACARHGARTVDLAGWRK